MDLMQRIRAFFAKLTYGSYGSDQLGRTMYSNHTQEAENIEFEKRTYGLIAESLASKYEEVYYVYICIYFPYIQPLLYHSAYLF